jgi:uncharacterized Zn-finger protein
MKNKYTREVTCPYCFHEFHNSWEYQDDEEIYCECCDNNFGMKRHVEVTYLTFKKESEANNE